MEWTLSDFARLAHAQMSSATWELMEGGAAEERALAANLKAFEQVRAESAPTRTALRPDTATEILGRSWAAPVAVAPLAYQALAHPLGELATVRGAAAAGGVPVVVSTFAGRTLEELAAEGGVPLWLQVYSLHDRPLLRRLVERAENAGFEALVLTFGTPHAGGDAAGDLRLPSGLTPTNLGAKGCAGPARITFDPGPDWPVVEWLRSVTSLPVVVKGVLTGAGARHAADAGADGVVVSNHGGRDGVPATLDALPEVASAVAGRLPVLLDGGVRRGQDVLAALALGADAVLLGRPVLHGLSVGAAEGVARVLTILLDELRTAMAYAGHGAVADVAAPPPARERGPALRLADLHASVADPVMDTLNFLNEVTLRYPEAVSFAPGRPYDGFFDTEQIFTYIRRYLDHLAATGRTPAQVRDTVFQYGPSAGLIRGLVADSLRTEEGIDVPPESIVVTVGCQEAMFLTLRALLAGPDDVVLVSSPSFMGITGAARLLDADVVAVEEREDGLSCADVEAAILAERARGRRPRAVYVIPDHSNPSGLTTPLETRYALLDLAERQDVLILEDSPYRLVSPGAQVPTLKSLDRNRRVIHLGSYAKTVFPGARVGYVVADQPVQRPDGTTGLLAAELAKIKSMVTVNTSALSQAAVAGALLQSGGRVGDLNADTAAYYGDTMRFTLQTLERVFAPERRARLGVSWNAPAGGFFLAMKVPFRADNAALARSAQDFGVIWTPMSYFHPHGGGDHMIRLSTSYLTHADAEEGVSRLSAFIESEAATRR
ncbi:aminotransferase class I/II-fold pyridoxal phosphate-dependent enzyme [Actinomadura sp. DC4]|uniref:aminotransferase class I/II-fold pyridoxal phosphate-dependent enzyme n=1 Tax=Actinomadura sp. DC4 TaxID=3055069 RepID=UPI0025B0A060|nr:aminotransferase class I/II-fold pyridoxal phosphate-dependent enzyme [Actinomadura sp. DC4]MDN3359009.1 aminotransferase class I/II-fold pyridoxal phosphate-dependent enzyme [Actinomadura sp. DC4]